MYPDRTFDSFVESTRHLVTPIVRDHATAGVMRRGHVLDLGAGDVFNNSLWLAGQGFTVTAIDTVYNDETTAPHDRISVVAADFAVCSLPEADHAIAIYSLRFHDRDVVLSFVRRLTHSLSSGGLLIVRDFNMDQPMEGGLPGRWFVPEEVADACHEGSSYVHVTRDSGLLPTIYKDQDDSQIYAQRSTIVAVI